MAHKRSINSCSFTSIIQVVTVLTDKPEVNRSMQPFFLKNLSSFYSTPTPKGWREAGKVIALIDCFFVQ